MNKSRVEAFTDGVIAIAITIMVLALKVPDGPHWTEVLEMAPVLCSYLLSFVYVGIYWVNHHHVLQLARQVNGRILWTNLHLLFWLSLVPLVTAWAGNYPLTPAPMALYGVVLLMCALAFRMLVRALVANEGPACRWRRRLAIAARRNCRLRCTWWRFVCRYGMRRPAPLSMWAWRCCG